MGLISTCHVILYIEAVFRCLHDGLPTQRLIKYISSKPPPNSSLLLVTYVRAFSCAYILCTAEFREDTNERMSLHLYTLRRTNGHVCILLSAQLQDSVLTIHECTNTIDGFSLSTASRDTKIPESFSIPVMYLVVDLVDLV